MTNAATTTEEKVRHPIPSALLHDLRTPLNHILGYSEMLVEQAAEAGQDDIVPFLQKVCGAGHRLLVMIDENFRSSGTDGPAGLSELIVSQKAPIAELRPLRTPDSTQGSVLIVDDVEANREVLEQRLLRQGYAVGTAESGADALNLMSTQAFDLVLLDIMMPEMDGYECLRRLMADERQRHIPVVMLSAIHEPDSVARCLALGAEDYLAKPFNPVVLLARVSSSIAKKRARDGEILLYEELQQSYHRLQEREGSR